MPLSDFLHQYQNNLIGGLAGGAIGAGLSGMSTSPDMGESDEAFSKRRNSTMLTGGLAGTALGAAAPSIANVAGEFLPKTEPTGRLGKIWHMISPTNNSVSAAATGGVVGTGAGAAAGTIAQGALNKGVDVTNKTLKTVADQAASMGEHGVADQMGRRIISSAGKIHAHGRLGLLLSVLGGAAGTYLGPKVLTNN